MNAAPNVSHLPDSASQSNAQRIAQLAGVAYCGPGLLDEGTLHYFREPVTGTGLALWDRDLTFAALQSSVAAAHARFAAASDEARS